MRNSFGFLWLLFPLAFSSCNNPVSMDPSFRIHTIRLLPGQDVLPELKKFVSENNIQAGFIMSAVGSLTQYHIRFANQPDGVRDTGHFEVVSLTGLLSVQGNHIHISISDSTGRTIGGHLLDSNFVYTTLEVVIGEDPAHVYHRETDSTYGYKELQVRQR